MTRRPSPLFIMLERRRVVGGLLIFCCWICATALTVSANESAAAPGSPTANVTPHFYVRGYTVEGVMLSTNILVPLFSKYTGTNVSLEEVVKAASDLQSAYHDRGYPAMSVAFVPGQISDGIVTFNVVQTAIPQIVIAGERYLSFSNGLVVVSRSPGAVPQPPVLPGAQAVSPARTNAVPPAANFVTRRASHQEMVDAMTALHLKMQDLEIQAHDTRVHVASTNAGPRFEVKKYLVDGNTILPSSAIGQAVTNIDGAFGTNVGFDGIETVVTELGKAYHERGYVTVAVNVPQQKLTNATVKLQVLEGRLADIKVAGNRYFSSNNVMRSMPSLRTNLVLNGLVFNTELNRANANQDRQIYPVIGPGLDPDTSELTLNVKDRLPFHAKLELNNQASPDTPDLRINSSAVYDNLWQLEHSIGVQYGFSPLYYKQGTQPYFFDGPMVVNYSAYYRMPLGGQESVEKVIGGSSGSFGYDEATRKFNLPPASGRPDLTFFASRSTIDTGVTPTFSEQVTAPGSNPSISRQDVEDSPTKNEDLGAHLNFPLPASGNYQSAFSGGVDFKTYEITNYKTNIFFITQTNFDVNGFPILPPISSTVPSAVPLTASRIDYLPLSLRYDGNWHDSLGTTTFGVGVSANVWNDSIYSTTATDTNGIAHTTSLHGVTAVTNITGSTQSSGYWVVLNPSFTRDITIDNWTTLFRADGQWASEPLISPEQFGAGGVNSVRGYHEGEVFGDTGWHLSLEQQTPPHVVGSVYDGTPLTVRGSFYMDYARVYLIDPGGRQGSTPLWGTGFGFSASAGSHWQAQLLFSWPLLSAGTTPAYQPFFNFALTAQF